MDKKINCIDSALIVGGGIGGMALAISLARRGVEVNLIDLDPEWKVYGAGITITGPTLRAYKDLGMFDQIASHGAVTSGSRVFRYDGVHLQDLDEPEIDGGLPVTGGIMRPVLHRLMQEEVRALSIPVRLGLTVTSLSNASNRVDVVFSDGSLGKFDLVVGADGIFSTVRQIAFPHMGAVEETGQGCWRVSMKRPPGLKSGEFFLGHPYAVGITPCGEDQVYLWMLTPHVHREQFMSDEELYEGLRQNLADFGGNAGWIRDNMTRDDWINYRPLVARLQPRPWFAERVALLGDAVHATTPHLASGAGMAVESAIVMAEELANSDDVIKALTQYEIRRFERCKDVVDTSLLVGRMQLEGAGAEDVGNQISGALHRLAKHF